MSLSIPESHPAPTVLTSRTVRWSLSVFHSGAGREVHVHTTHRVESAQVVLQALALEEQRPGYLRAAIGEHVTESLSWPVTDFPDLGPRSVPATYGEQREFFHVPAYGSAPLASGNEVLALLADMHEQHAQGRPGIQDPAGVVVMRCVSITQTREVGLDDLPAG